MRKRERSVSGRPERRKKRGGQKRGKVLHLRISGPEEDVA